MVCVGARMERGEVLSWAETVTGAVVFDMCNDCLSVLYKMALVG